MNHKNTIDLLLKASEQGVVVKLKDDQLVFKRRKDKTISPELIEELGDSKVAILDLLRQEKVKAESRSSGGQLIESFDRPTVEKIPLSYSQRSAWFQEKIIGNRIDVTTSTFRFLGTLDAKALSYAINQVVKRYEVLRTLIKEDEDGYPYQEIAPFEMWGIDVVDEQSESKNESYYTSKYSATDFDLSIDFPFQARLITCSDQEHVLSLLFHHICTDETSEHLITKEIIEFYKAKTTHTQPDLPEIKIQYADYAVWQNNYFKSAEFEKKLNFWKNNLSEVNAVRLPHDREENKKHNGRAKDVHFSLPQNTSRKIKDYVAANDVTSYMFFLPTFKYYYTSTLIKSDICVGVPVANRTHQTFQKC